MSRIGGKLPPSHRSPWQFIPRLTAHIAGFIATLVLAGWVFHIPALVSVVPRSLGMKANTALAFLLLASALHLSIKGRHRRIQAALAFGAALTGAFTMFEYLTGREIGIDQLLFSDPTVTPYPGRMSTITATNFILLGLSMLPLERKTWQILREILALAVVMSSVFAIVGYVYGVPFLYGAISSTSTAMAFHTGASFTLLAFGWLSIPREDGLVRIFRGDSIAAMVARFLVPVAIFVPVLLGGIFMNERLSMRNMPLAMALSVVSNVVLLVALVWYFCFMIERTERERVALQQEAETDKLTGIYNRRYFETQLEHEVDRARRYGMPLSLIMFDLDDFKKLNDKYGHLAGDQALMRVARECERSLRSSDVFCRYGGEEFAIIAPGLGAVHARLLARRLREAIAELVIGSVEEPLTISAGVAIWQRGFDSKKDLVGAADKALYQAKESGKNRECVYSQAEEQKTTTAKT